jgi:hypothetical protein
MKNFQKLVLGLIVGAMAIGFSSFTNAKVVKKSKFTTYYYTNNGTDYVAAGTSQPSSADCSGTSSQYCIVSSSTNLDADAPFAISNPSHYPISAVGTSKAEWSN